MPKLTKLVACRTTVEEHAELMRLARCQRLDLSELLRACAECILDYARSHGNAIHPLLVDRFPPLPPVASKRFRGQPKTT